MISYLFYVALILTYILYPYTRNYNFKYKDKICGPFKEGVTLTSIIEDIFNSTSDQFIIIIKNIFYNWWLIIFLTGTGLIYVQS